ncbi:protein-L-isoaspartate(D-aspartate) O-methyltransferase [Mariprofundus ferrinatatus]|uniref:Protein-L-isoaspartate O-methyltransferase n=1 Tax=Mariprofundus ferrinatatus TaxID=1921087 RepID=A0A2K8L389_9PROT|nr:rRNA adenine N-6-methyltransferase family protein [Mariprofundus ferrinatatus]ATX81800.1 protein-L-isoaspartate(D-aspartate) O-methyltransferase [Mariprofundus ferrinatatus]
MTATDFQSARRNMVEYQIRCCKVLDPATLDLIESMPRENFVPKEVRSLAYMEGHVPLPCDQEMLTPLQEAMIMQTLMLEGGERVLEIGTGTGFLTTMLAMQAAEVVGCEIHAPLADLSQENISNHGINNATIVQVNAMDAEAIASLAEMKQPFDAIVLGAAVKEIPPHIEALLKEGGQIMAFIGSNPVVSLVHRRKAGLAWQETTMFETLLQDMEGVPVKREFVF